MPGRGASDTGAEPVQNCPLRGLTLCDGQVLEEPDGGLTTCLCRLRAAAKDVDDDQGYHALGESIGRLWSACSLW